jgi:hypothetical protein
MQRFTVSNARVTDLISIASSFARTTTRRRRIEQGASRQHAQEQRNARRATRKQKATTRERGVQTGQAGRAADWSSASRGQGGTCYGRARSGAAGQKEQLRVRQAGTGRWAGRAAQEERQEEEEAAGLRGWRSLGKGKPQQRAQHVGELGKENRRAGKRERGRAMAGAWSFGRLGELRRVGRRRLGKLLGRGGLESAALVAGLQGRASRTCNKCDRTGPKILRGLKNFLSQ